MNINYMGMSSDNKLVREITKIIKEDEEKVKQTKSIQEKKYKAVSRDGDTLEIGASSYQW